MGLTLDPRLPMLGGMITGVFGLEFWRQETVAQTESVELSGDSRSATGGDGNDST